MNKINAGLYCYITKLNQSYQRGKAAIQSGYISVKDEDNKEVKRDINMSNFGKIQTYPVKMKGNEKVPASEDGKRTVYLKDLNTKECEEYAESVKQEILRAFHEPIQV
jgi:pyruvate/2-oxoacid:ferredoxin oxidoreductase beta subunit